MDVLVSGASIAGPVLAYWLTRYGFQVTVVERAPTPRKAGGHAVDLFAPAMDIIQRMGVLDAVQERRTGTERIIVRRESAARPVTIDLTRLMGALSRRHVEIMRDDLAAVFHAATRDDVEYVFGDSVATVSVADGAVRFESGASRRFDLVIGADGLHSLVRRLVFGPDAASTTWLGAYLAVATVPDHLGLRASMVGVTGVDRLVGVYGTRDPGQARAVFLFRPPAELTYHHRDVTRQKTLLHDAFADFGDDVAPVLKEALRADVFYFDAITQLQMDTWSRGRVTLVGDAGYCPGPAVGGSTSLAVVGAFTLAGELAVAGGDHTVAFPAYERAMADYVRRSRAFAASVADRLLPRTPVQVWAMTSGVGAFSRLPLPLLRVVVRGSTGQLGMHDTIVPKDYPAVVGRRSADGPPPGRPRFDPRDPAP